MTKKKYKLCHSVCLENRWYQFISSLFWAKNSHQPFIYICFNPLHLLLVAINSLQGEWMGTEWKPDGGSHAEDDLLLEVKSCIHNAREKGRILSYTWKLHFCNHEEKYFWQYFWFGKKCIFSLIFQNDTMHQNFQSLLGYFLWFSERGFSLRKDSSWKQEAGISIPFLHL